MEIVFVRHAEPAWAVDGKAQMDPFLTDRGLEQAALMAARLTASRRPIARGFCSPATRCQQTAAPLVESGIAFETVDDLVEVRLPNWQDQPAEEIARTLQAARKRPASEWWDGLPDGESFRDFHRRVSRCIDGLLGQLGFEHVGRDPSPLWRMREDVGRVVIVGHGGTNAVAIGHLLGLPPAPYEWDRIALSHASIAKLRAVPIGDAHILSLRESNDASHLPKHLRTG